jgi:uncharacterized protein
VTGEEHSRPVIWVLQGLRTGDNTQAMDLALALNGHVIRKPLQFNPMHAVPNWMVGQRIFHVTAQSRALLCAPWPDLVVATGRRTAPVSLWIKEQSGGRTKIVQLGRPRLPLSRFDLVLTTPQYGLAAERNVEMLSLPFVRPKIVAQAERIHFSEAWKHLPRPHILAVIGGGKFPLRMTSRDLAEYGKLLGNFARSQNGSVILLDSPRSPPEAVSIVAQELSVPHWVPERGADSKPYQPALALCDLMVVTSDSVMMMSEMLLTGKPTQIFELARSMVMPRWSSKSGVMGLLARSGILHPPRNVYEFIRRLKNEQVLGDLRQGVAAAKPFRGAAFLDTTVERVRRLLE